MGGVQSIAQQKKEKEAKEMKAKRKPLKNPLNVFKEMMGVSNDDFLNGDFDGDGVPNWKDCRPFDPTRQDGYGPLHYERVEDYKRLISDKKRAASVAFDAGWDEGARDTREHFYGAEDEYWKIRKPRFLREGDD